MLIGFGFTLPASQSSIILLTLLFSSRTLLHFQLELVTGKLSRFNVPGNTADRLGYNDKQISCVRFKFQHSLVAVVNIFVLKYFSGLPSSAYSILCLKQAMFIYFSSLGYYIVIIIICSVIYKRSRRSFYNLIIIVYA